MVKFFGIIYTLLFFLKVSLATFFSKKVAKKIKNPCIIARTPGLCLRVTTLIYPSVTRMSLTDFHTKVYRYNGRTRRSLLVFLLVQRSRMYWETNLRRLSSAGSFLSSSIVSYLFRSLRLDDYITVFAICQQQKRLFFIF